MKGLFFAVSIPLLAFSAGRASAQEGTTFTNAKPICTAFYGSVRLQGSSVPTGVKTLRTSATSTITTTRTSIVTISDSYTAYDRAPSGSTFSKTVLGPVLTTHTALVTTHKYKTYVTSTVSLTLTVTTHRSVDVVATIPTPSGFGPVASLSTYLSGWEESSFSYLTSVTCTTTLTSVSVVTKTDPSIYTSTSYIYTVYTSTEFYSPTKTFTKPTTARGTSTIVYIKYIYPSSTYSYTILRTTTVATSTLYSPTPSSTQYDICEDPANYVSHLRYNSTKVLPLFSVWEKSDKVSVEDIELDNSEYGDFTAQNPKQCCEACAARPDECTGAIFNYQSLGYYPNNFCVLLKFRKDLKRTCDPELKQWYGVVSLDQQSSRVEQGRYVIMNGPCGRGGIITERQRGCGDKCPAPACIYNRFDCDFENT